IFVRLYGLHMKKGFRCSSFGTEFYSTPLLSDHFTQCLAIVIHSTPTHLMSLLEMRRSFQELSVSTIQKCWKNGLSLVALMSRQYLHILILSSIFHGLFLGSSLPYSVILFVTL
ncbi:hypothetical protein S245_044800, partial [Arachis hypogaea]